MDDWEGFDPDSVHNCEPEEDEQVVCLDMSDCDVQNHPWGLGLCRRQDYDPYLLTPLECGSFVRLHDECGRCYDVPAIKVRAIRRPCFSVEIARWIWLWLYRSGVPRGTRRWLVPMIAQKCRLVSKDEIPFCAKLVTRSFRDSEMHECPLGLTSIQWWKFRKTHHLLMDDLKACVVRCSDIDSPMGCVKSNRQYRLYTGKLFYLWDRKCFCKACNRDRVVRHYNHQRL